ncbi:MAG: aminopeptidase P N-terminal domain-containing protein [Bacteroidia bacterium]|nr:aminopeptidase P N-terminal domain-containing protein [Bacteroidia bacterium]
MKYTAPSKDLFIRNRENFAKKVKPGHMAIFFSNDLIHSNADAHYNFRQNSSMYYLSGIDQEECALILFPDAPKPEWKEMLFVRETNEQIQIWEGWKYSKKEAEHASGIRQIKYYPDLETTLLAILPYAEGIYLDFDEHQRHSFNNWSASRRFAEKLRHEWPAHGIHSASKILTRLRAIKHPEELQQIKVACSITEKAFRRVLDFVRPGVAEYEVEAEILHEFIRHRSRGPAYTSIIASGRSACVLHYILNDKKCKDGDLLLMDFGAEYGNYASDLTRTIPVNGRFTKRQKEVYNACLRVFRGASEMLVPGTLMDEYHVEVGKMMTSELLGLGLLTKDEVEKEDPAWPAYKKYFMHGTSHSLGLDTHDILHRYEPFQAGMVFTCEPGIYILEENLGVRIENDILLTPNGNEDLMAHIPIETDEIEALMNK